MRTLKATVAALVLTAAGIGSAAADPITGLFATGVDNGGALLALGATDTHYNILETGNDGLVISSTLPATWLANNATSQWIWEQANGQPVNVTRTFRTTFDLTGLDASTAQISGTWAVDNVGDDILINGVSTGNTVNGFGAFANFNINSGFVSGLNTIDFVARDVGFISGFRVGSISGTADALAINSLNTVPEPASLALLGMGLAGIGAMRRRHNS